MATKPQMTDLRGKLPRNPNGRNGGRRTLKQIKTAGVHWGGPPPAGANGGVDAEIAILRSYATYHAFSRDWSSNGSNLRHDTIAYTIAVGQSGTIYLLNDLERIGWHIKHGNVESLGILWIGGKGQTPTKAALDSLRAVVDWIVSDPAFSVVHSQVWGHGECGGQYGGGPMWYGNSTECPGPDLLKWVRAYRKGQPLPTPVPPPTVPPTHTFYPETGYSVGNAIREHHLKQGGAGGHLGFPLSGEFQGKIADGGDKVYTLQLFERGLVHYRAGEGTGEVRTGPMVRSILEMQGFLVPLE